MKKNTVKKFIAALCSVAMVTTSVNGSVLEVAAEEATQEEVSNSESVGTDEENVGTEEATEADTEEADTEASDVTEDEENVLEESTDAAAPAEETTEEAVEETTGEAESEQKAETEEAAEETATGAASTEFAVLSTTDMHGRCWATNVLNDEKVTNSMLQTSTAVQSVRKEYGKDNVLLVDNGDLFQGTAVSTLNMIRDLDEFSGITPMAICLKYMDYDVLSIGNHEFNYKWNTMQSIYKYLENDDDVNGDGKGDPVNVLAANLVYEDTKDGHAADENVLTPYVIRDIQVGDKTMQVGILGLENTDCPRWDISDNYPNMRFAHNDNPTFDLSKEVNRYVPEMKAKGADYIIVSYHSGIGSYTEDDLKFGINTENQASRILANTKGMVDMMILGHDHSNSYSNNYYQDGSGKNVLVVNGGGTDLTKTVLEATEKADGSFDVSIKNTQNVELKNYEVDKTLEGMMKDYADNAIEYVNTPCGKIADAGWDKKTGFYVEQTDTMDLINRSQIYAGQKYLEKKYDTAEKRESLQKEKNYKEASDVCNIDISATSVVVSNNTTVRPGDISLKNIYQFYKYDNNLYVLPMTGQQIKDALEFVAAKRYGYTIKGGKVRYKTIDDYFTCPIFYGLDFTYDMSKEEGNRVVIDKFTNGKAFELNRTYNLAINNYHLSNGPFAAYKPEDTIWSQTDDLGGGTVQEMIAEFVRAAGDKGVAPEDSNWKLTYTAELPKEEEKVAKKPANVYDPIPDATFEKDYPGAVTVAEAGQTTSGKITVVGQVVYKYDKKKVIIEDVVNGQIYGYMIYGFDPYENVAIGDIVKVTGDATVYSGLPEISGPAKEDVVVIKHSSETEMIQPEVVTVQELADQQNAEYLNKYVVVQNLTASKSELKDGAAKLKIYSGKSLPQGIEEGKTKIDFYGVCSIYGSDYQFINNSSDDYKEHKGTYDPVTDDMFTDGAVSIAQAAELESGKEVTVIAQVATTFGAADGTNQNNIVLQDVVNGETVGLLTYDKEKVGTWYIGDVVRVTGKMGSYGGAPQIVPSKVERVKTEICFQPQNVTVKDINDGSYLNEYVKLKNVKLGSYNAAGSTTVEDATGSINIYKGCDYPANVNAGDTVDLTAVASIYNGTYQLRVGSSYDYVKKEVAGEKEVDKTLVRIPVVETTDVHGFLLDVSSGSEDTYQYRMAYISDKVNDLRKNSDVILLDSGDIYQGNPVSNLVYGESMIEAYDAMGYDAVSVGNHEFDWDITKLLDNDATMGSYTNAKGEKVDSKIPVVCKNIYHKSTSEQKGTSVNFTRDYEIIEKKGKALDQTEKTYKVAVFGYVEDYSSDIMAAKIAPYEIHEDDLEEIEAEAARLEKEKKVDATILLTHEDASRAAGKVKKGSAIDLVCGGHTHYNEKGVSKTGIPFVEAKNQAANYCYAELCFDKDGKVTVENAENVAVTEDKTKLYDTKENAEELDPKVVEISKAAVAKVAPIMNEELGTVTEQITKAAIGGNSYSSTAGTWMCELMNLATGADVSFTNNGGIRTEFAFEGAERMMTVGDIYTIAPFANTLPTFDVSYEKLKEIIEFAVGGKATGLALRMGGATAYYDNKGNVTTLFVGNRLCYNNNEWVENKDNTVRVCTNEYIATSSGTPFASMTSNEAKNQTAVKTDNEEFIAVLKREAAANNGKLFVNTQPTLVEHAWDGTTIPVVHEIKEVPKTTYTVHFDANHKAVTGKMKDQTVTSSESVKLTKNKFKATGYTFTGWATSKNGKVVYKDAAAIKDLAKAGESITLYAQWKANTYKVVFDKNSKAAKGNMKAQTVTYGKSTKLNKNSYKLAKYSFKGWAVSKKGKAVYKDAAAVKNLTAKANGTVTVYAVWEKTTVAKANVRSVTAKKSTLFIKWNEVKNADGYTVICSRKSDFSKVAKTVNVTKRTSLQIKKAKVGQRYYVKVCAYRKDSTGKKIVGKYSTVKSVIAK